MKAFVNIIFVLLIFFILNQTSGVKLNCTDVIAKNLNPFPDACEVFDTFEENDTISEVQSNSFPSKYKMFQIPNESNTTFIPFCVCEYLLNLEFIYIYGAKIEKITCEVFKSCENVAAVEISGTKIKFLPENSFNHLINVETLEISGNRIKKIPSKLFSKNSKLRKLDASNNRIKIVDLQFSYSTQQVDLTKNDCISYKMDESEQAITHLNKMISACCGLSSELHSDDVGFFNFDNDVYAQVGQEITATCMFERCKGNKFDKKMFWSFKPCNNTKLWPSCGNEPFAEELNDLEFKEVNEKRGKYLISQIVFTPPGPGFVTCYVGNATAKVGKTANVIISNFTQDIVIYDEPIEKNLKGSKVYNEDENIGFFAIGADKTICCHANYKYQNVHWKLIEAVNSYDPFQNDATNLFNRSCLTLRDIDVNDTECGFECLVLIN
jgi:hypothetical protein